MEMAATAFTANAKVTSEGQVTIPWDVRAVLGVQGGDKVTFIVEGDVVRVANAASYAMQVLQKQMIGEATAAEITSEDDVMDLISQMCTET